MDHVTDSANHVDGINHRDALWRVGHTNRDPITFFDAVILEGAGGFFNLFDEVFESHFVAIVNVCSVVWPSFGTLNNHVYHGAIRVFNIAADTLFVVKFQPRAGGIFFFAIFHKNSP